jgi:hypothetical protein
MIPPPREQSVQCTRWLGRTRRKVYDKMCRENRDVENSRYNESCYGPTITMFFGWESVVAILRALVRSAEELLSIK